MDEKIIELKYPIPVPKEGGGMMDVLNLKLGRFKAKHLKSLPKDFSEKGGQIGPAEMIPLIASIADIPEESADELDIEDLMVLAGEVASFLGKSLGTGTK